MKKDQDSLQRFVFENTPVRGNLVNLSHTLQFALNKQNLPAGLKRSLGELMAASALLSATLKMNGSLILQIQSKGVLKLLVVECTTAGDAPLKMRATAKWTGEISDQADLFDLISQGQCIITLDPQDGTQTYQGIVPLEGHSISALLENYMLRSEQIDTRIWLCCDGESAAGMLLQKLPDTMNQTTVQTDSDVWNRVGHLASTVTDDELLNLPAEILLTRLFHEEDVRLFNASNTQFYCACSRNSVANMLRMLGNEELDSILVEQGQIEVNCDFCNSHYAFDKIDAAQLLMTPAAAPGSPEVH